MWKWCWHCAGWLVKDRESARGGGGGRCEESVFCGRSPLYRSFSSLVTLLVMRPHSSPTRKRMHTLREIISRIRTLLSCNASIRHDISGQREGETSFLFDLQQVDFQTLLHLTRLLLSCCLLCTQPGDLRREERGEERRGEERRGEERRGEGEFNENKELDHSDLILTVWRQPLDHTRQKHSVVGTDLVGVFEFEAGDDLALQLAVLARLVQDGLAELWDVGPASFPQHRSEDLLVAALTQVLLLLLQTLDHLGAAEREGEILKTPPVFSMCDAPHLSVTKGHVGTQTADVRLTGIVQLWFQPDILRLKERERRIIQSVHKLLFSQFETLRYHLQLLHPQLFRHLSETRCSLASCSVSFLTVVLRQITTSTLRHDGKGSQALMSRASIWMSCSREERPEVQDVQLGVQLHIQRPLVENPLNLHLTVPR
ncbi:hypothetical protein F7725_026728 [Dissostichus mawsoni]|uniref:Uncharacterized protein n=1 Tax=Dissostichus mawsoni TaxID=36200 RepID=A0A7J5X897_DISMA|nr:hypothetical protein F7725_026728 [Dissostichus mawsoni]